MHCLIPCPSYNTHNHHSSYESYNKTNPINKNALFFHQVLVLPVLTHINRGVLYKKQLLLVEKKEMTQPINERKNKYSKITTNKKVAALTNATGNGRRQLLVICCTR